MASQNSQRVRRIGSPSTSKQGPMKATLPFGLKQNSPTFSRSSNGRKNSPTSSPTPQWGSESHRKNRKSPENRNSPDRNSPSSPGIKVPGAEKFRPIRQSPGPHSGKRTGTLDTITAPYLKGEWPRAANTDFLPIPQSHSDRWTVLDKATQTPEEWDEGQSDRRRKSSSHKRSSSTGNNDGYVKKGIKLRLNTAKVKEVARATQNVSSTGAGRASPVPLAATHSLVTTAITPTLTITPATQVQTKAMAIPCSIPRPTSRVRGSVEGLNQEIEKLVLSNHSGNETQSDEKAHTQGSYPDGHKAPVLELLYGIQRSNSRTVDTQTPSGYPSDRYGLISDDLLLNGVEWTGTDCDSPNELKQMFVREPPDGCEKVKIMEESRPLKLEIKEAFEFCQIKKPCENRCLIPSAVSAFCPLIKSYVNQPSEMALMKSQSPTSNTGLSE